MKRYEARQVRPLAWESEKLISSLDISDVPMRRDRE
jgi:hypothetical protein